MPQCGEDSTKEGAGATEHHFHLHLITDGAQAARPLLESVTAAVRGGVDWVQVRDKTAPARELWQTAQAVRAVLSGGGAGLLINDRVDVALALPAEGVHLAKKSLPPQAVRPLLRPWQLVGCSVHSIEEARQAEVDGADYITFGHVFATPSKSWLEPRGVVALAAVVEAVNIPVLAIGGIAPDNIEQVLGTGCAGIAVIGAVLGSPDPEQAAVVLREAMDRVPFRPKVPFPRVPDG